MENPPQPAAAVAEARGDERLQHGVGHAGAERSSVVHVAFAPTAAASCAAHSTAGTWAFLKWPGAARSAVATRLSAGLEGDALVDLGGGLLGHVRAMGRREVWADSRNFWATGTRRR